MDLATRCPHCATAFRVVPDQIRLRGGWVRCGVCNEAFDTADCLFELDAAGGPPRPVSRRAAPEADAGGDPRVVRKRGERLAGTGPAEPAPAPDPTTEEAAPALSPAAGEPPVEAEPVAEGSVAEERHPPSADDLPVVLRSRRAALAFGEATVSPAPDHVPLEPVAAPIPPRAADADGLDDANHAPPTPLVAEPRSGYPAPAVEEDFFDEEAKRRRRRATWLWSIAALIALLVLLGQGIWMFRAELATQVPSLRPLLENVCLRLQCTVGYPRAPELLVIESSSVEPWSPDSPGFAPPIADPLIEAGEMPSQVVLPVRRLALRIVLRNRAAFPQAWPAIELSLMDLSDAVAARRVLLPSVYLAPQDLAKPLGPLEERNLRIPIETIDAHATGYRVAIFYP